MSSPLLGAIGKFDPSTETFTVFSESLDQFFVANNIGSYPASASEEVIAAAEKKKVAVMISVIGKKTYTMNPKDKTFKQLSELLQQHFKPKQLEVTESYRFHHCFQEKNETVSVYSPCFRHLESTCNFREFLNGSL